ncbi:MAG: DUF6057 family protein [Bacteroidales bacterium]
MEKKSATTHFLLSALFGLSVFLFFGLVYPHHLHYHEQFQLFLSTPAYFLQLMAKPGGLAEYMASFLTQFFLFSWSGAAIMAVLLTSLQMIIAGVSRRLRENPLYYPLSFIPAFFFWSLLCDENMMPAGILSVLIAMVTWRGYLEVKHIGWKTLYLVILIPITYWFGGGSAVIPVMGIITCEWMNKESRWSNKVLTTLCALSVTVAVLLLIPLLLPQFPYKRMLFGTDFFRFPVYYPTGIPVLWGLLWLIPVINLFLPASLKKAGKSRLLFISSLVLIFVAGGLLVMANRDAGKEEVMAYDHYVRMQHWDKVIKMADRRSPSSPLAVACLNLALCKSGKMSDNMFHYFQNGPEGLIPTFTRDFTIPMITGEIYYHLGFINTAQRFAFEAMESLPNYWKSGRALKRLAETNLINGEYKVAAKYLRILTHTTFYKKWAHYVLGLLRDETAINTHPEWGYLRTYRSKTDFLDSENEKDMMLGILLQQNLTHYMAYEYLLSYCLLAKDLEHFMEYFPLGMKLRYDTLPVSYQEALLYVWSLSHEDPLKTVPYSVSDKVRQQLAAYQQLYLNASDPEQALKKNYSGTYWYYLHFR